MTRRTPRVVALGGGHGLAASLTALRQVTRDLTAVVTVADDGGSSGRLREEFGVLPPGDLRMALAALCDEDLWGETWAKVLQHRFASEGELDGHSTGNLLIVTVWDLLGDHVKGLDLVGQLLGARGRVLPMALDPLVITATVQGADPAKPDEVTLVEGQVEVATTGGRLLEVGIQPQHPTPCPQALAAIAEADWVVLGPGSWYTSVIPHVLVPELREALCATPARVLVNLNLQAQEGETEGLSPADHYRVLLAHAPGLKVDTVLADSHAVADLAALRSVVVESGAELVCDDIARVDVTDQHHPGKLALAYARLMAGS